MVGQLQAVCSETSGLPGKMSGGRAGEAFGGAHVPPGKSLGVFTKAARSRVAL